MAMKISNKAGFTIVETMLFLGISGLLMLGVLVGTGTSINTQRYHDSVSSLQSILQQQFSETSNVINSNSTSACGSNSSVQRGQSDCVFLGRYITTTDGMNLSIRNVIGKEPPSSNTSVDDVSVLQSYVPYISSVAGDIYNMNWGASLVQPGSSNVALFSMLILRSPSSGVIRTFIDPSYSVTNISSLINKTALSQSVKVCVASNGLFTGGKSAVLMTANATGPGGIETLGEAKSGC